MLAILCSAPRPPLGVALLGLLITAIGSTLRLLPYIMLCSIIVLSIWVPPRPAGPEVMYYLVDGHPQHLHVVYTSPPENGTSGLNACLRILFPLLSVPATAIFENLLFRPTRDLFLQTVEAWYDIRYVQPVLATGSWPDTWTPILNALRSFQFIADFIDGINYTPDPSHERKARPVSMQPCTPNCDTGECDGSPSRKCLAMRKASSSCRTVHWKSQRKPNRKHTSSPYSVIQSKAEDSSNIFLPRKTFISPPRASSPRPPCNRSFRASSPVSRDLSRMIGVFFRHPTSFKPVPRPRFNIDAKALFARAKNVDFKLSYSTPSAPISPLKASACDSVISCPDFMKIPEQVEQTLLTKSSDNSRLSPVPQRTEPQVPMRPWLSVSASQEERPIQRQSTQSPTFHTAPHQEQYMPVYESTPSVSASNNLELSMDRPQRIWGTMAFEQQQLSEHMDIDLDFSLPLMHGLEHDASTLESAVPACSPFRVDHFANALQSQFSNSGLSFSYGPGGLQCTSGPPFAYHQEVLLPSSPQCIPPSEPFPTGPCAPKWTTSYPQPATMTLVSQPHIIQNVSATETFSFIVDPDTAIPHFAFSEQPTLATPTSSGHTECMSIGDMSPDGIHVSQPFDQKVRSPPISSDHQPKMVLQASPPIDSTKVKAGDKHDNNTSDSDTSDSDYTESSSEDSGDSDDSSSSEDDEGDTSTAIAGPSKIDKGKGKAP